MRDKKFFVYELIIIFFIIYLLYISFILMLIYVYADVAPIRYGKRNKKPTSDIALREKTQWKEENTSGAFCTIIVQIKKERKKIGDVSDQHKQEWTMLTIREKKRRPFSKFNETRTVQDLIDAYIENKIRLENWETLSIKRNSGVTRVGHG
jgi:hypothetical protein